jgi:hypothetical protein
VLAFGFTGIRHPNFGGSRAHSSPPVVDPEGGEPLLYAYLHDPSGAGPRLSILQVPEPKTAKNRLHLEARVSGEGAEAERRARTLAKVDELTAAGGTALHVFRPHHVVMADPEGNEFCAPERHAGTPVRALLRDA